MLLWSIQLLPESPDSEDVIKYKKIYNRILSNTEFKFTDLHYIVNKHIARDL